MKEWFVNGKKQQTMSWAEFCEWMTDKTLHFADVMDRKKWCGDGWIEGKPDKFSLPPPKLPFRAFVLPDTCPLRPAEHNGSKHLSNVTADGRNCWDCEGFCRATLNSKRTTVHLSYRRVARSVSNTTPQSI